MPAIVRAFSVRFEHRVHFTRGVFKDSNSLLQTILPDPPRIPNVLVVLDEALATARPATIVRPPARTRFPRAALRRDGRVAEGARLESVYTGNRIVGSNPTPSAKIFKPRSTAGHWPFAIDRLVGGRLLGSSLFAGARSKGRLGTTSSRRSGERVVVS